MLPPDTDAGARQRTCSFTARGLGVGGLLQGPPGLLPPAAAAGASLSRSWACHGATCCGLTQTVLSWCPPTVTVLVTGAPGLSPAAALPKRDGT